jgi:hypothetical protein
VWLGSATIPLGSGKLSLLSIERRLSPNFGPRKGGLLPSLIVVHYTAMPDAQAALERLSDPAHRGFGPLSFGSIGWGRAACARGAAGLACGCGRLGGLHGYKFRFYWD